VFGHAFWLGTYPNHGHYSPQSTRQTLSSTQTHEVYKAILVGCIFMPAIFGEKRDHTLTCEAFKLPLAPKSQVYDPSFFIGSIFRDMKCLPKRDFYEFYSWKKEREN